MNLVCKPLMNGIMAYWTKVEDAAFYNITLYINEQAISKRINDLGSLANAWTSYYGTNYNIFGSINLRENLKLLLDIFYNTNINEKNVEEEKGIIGEEIDMYKDQLDGLLSQKLFNNLFHESYVKNTVLGERSDIEKITAKHLNQIYKDFYATNNTFIVVCGDFDENEVLEDIKKNIDLIKSSITYFLNSFDILLALSDFKEVLYNKLSVTPIILYGRVGLVMSL